MLKKLRPITPRGWMNLLRWMVTLTLGGMGLSLLFNFAVFLPLGHTTPLYGLYSAVVMPIIISSPLFLYVLLKLEELELQNRRLRKIAATDPLTSCLNRRAFGALVEAGLNGFGGRNAEMGGALLMIDADKFKAINDRYGHDRGDEALTLIARLIGSVLRDEDLVGRLGGEEFGVYLPGANLHGAASVAERLRKVVAEADFRPDGQPCQLTVSVGGAVYAEDIDYRTLYRSADQLLFEAKRSGRNCIALDHVTAVMPEPDDVVTMQGAA
jgi:diguanylate cyclase (GGDEF)-like protein